MRRSYSQFLFSRNIESRHVFSGSFEVTPVKAGDKEIIVSFTSLQLSDVTGTRRIKIQ